MDGGCGSLCSTRLLVLCTQSGLVLAIELRFCVMFCCGAARTNEFAYGFCCPNPRQMALLPTPPDMAWNADTQTCEGVVVGVGFEFLSASAGQVPRLFRFVDIRLIIGPWARERTWLQYHTQQMMAWSSAVYDIVYTKYKCGAPNRLCNLVLSYYRGIPNITSGIVPLLWWRLLSVVCTTGNVHCHRTMPWCCAPIWPSEWLLCSWWTFNRKWNRLEPAT